jgi:hypothetical protein
MPGSSTAQRGNELFAQVIYVPLVTVPNVAANATASQVVAVSGVQVGDLISWNQQGVVTGLAVDNIFVNAANSLTFYWTNSTVAAINASPPQPFLIEVTRPENVVDGGITTLANSIF